MKVQLRSVLPLAAAITLAAAEQETVIKQMGSDYFTAGKSVIVSQPVKGDLFAAGQTVGIDAPAAGDAVVAGGSVHLNSTIDQHVYAAGGRVTINGVVKAGARIAGGEVDIAPSADLQNLTVGGGQVRINGKVTGYLQAAGGHVYLNGPVDGDVEVSANRVELGPQARVSGKLRYRSREPLKRDPAALIAGGVEQLAVPAAWTRQAEGVGRGAASIASWVWTFGLAAAIAVLMFILPRFFADAADTLERQIGVSALTGFVMLVCVPVGALILIITGVGAPLGLLLVGGYLMLLLVGYLTAGAALGDVTLKRFVPAHSAEKTWRVGAASLAVFAIALVGEIPWLGGLIVFAALLVGIGALVLEMKHRLAPTGA